MVWPQPIGIFADEEGDGRYARRDYTAAILAAVLAGSRGFESCRMRRQTAPADGACEAQLIEVCGIVVGDPAGEHKTLPRAGRDFKSLQLADHFKRAVFAAHLRTRSDMLPSQQPTHELRGSDGGDLLAQGGNGQAMNASQQAALAPFGFGGGFYVGTAALGCPGERSSPISCARIIVTQISIMWASGTEPAAQNRTAGFNAEQGFFDLRSRQP